MPEEKIDPDRKVRECEICKRRIWPNEYMRKEPGTGMYFHSLCIKEAKKFLGISI